MDIDDRIVRLERMASEAYGSSIPGTRLTRVLHPVTGIEWSLLIGPMQQAGMEWRGPTVEHVLSCAEKWPGWKPRKTTPPSARPSQPRSRRR